MPKRKKNFSILDQINEENYKEQKSKDISSSQSQQFSEKQVNDFIAYNEKVTELDPIYSSLRPRHRDVILRLFVKDYTKEIDDTLAYSMTDVIPVQSGVNKEIVYMEVPSPYPFTRKAIVVSVPNEHFDIQPGDIVALKDKLQIGFKSQDKGYVSVQGGFVHPDEQDKYENMPEDPKDPNYGYVIINESNINLKLTTNAK